MPSVFGLTGRFTEDGLVRLDGFGRLDEVEARRCGALGGEAARAPDLHVLDRDVGVEEGVL